MKVVVMTNGLLGFDESGCGPDLSREDPIKLLDDAERRIYHSLLDRTRHNEILKPKELVNLRRLTKVFAENRWIVEGKRELSEAFGISERQIINWFKYEGFPKLEGGLYDVNEIEDFHAKRLKGTNRPVPRAIRVEAVEPGEKVKPALMLEAIDGRSKSYWDLFYARERALKAQEDRLKANGLLFDSDEVSELFTTRVIIIRKGLSEHPNRAVVELIEAGVIPEEKRKEATEIIATLANNLVAHYAATLPARFKKIVDE